MRSVHLWRSTDTGVAVDVGGDRRSAGDRHGRVGAVGERPVGGDPKCVATRCQVDRVAAGGVGRCAPCRGAGWVERVDDGGGHGTGRAGLLRTLNWTRRPGSDGSAHAGAIGRGWGCGRGRAGGPGGLHRGCRRTAASRHHNRDDQKESDRTILVHVTLDGPSVRVVPGDRPRAGVPDRASPASSGERDAPDSARVMPQAGPSFGRVVLCGVSNAERRVGRARWIMRGPRSATVAGHRDAYPWVRIRTQSSLLGSGPAGPSRSVADPSSGSTLNGCSRPPVRGLTNWARQDWVPSSRSWTV